MKRTIITAALLLIGAMVWGQEWYEPKPMYDLPVWARGMDGQTTYNVRIPREVDSYIWLNRVARCWVYASGTKEAVIIYERTDSGCISTEVKHVYELERPVSQKKKK